MKDFNFGLDLSGGVMRSIAVSLAVLLVAAFAGCSEATVVPPPPEEEELQRDEPAQAADENEDADVVSTEWSADGVIVSGEYPNLLDQGTYKLYWNSTESTLRACMQATTEGWLALGLQPGQRMKDADMILGMVVDGEPLVLDSYSSGDFGPHKADVEFGGNDDIMAFAGGESGGTTTIEFERALDTGDEHDIVLERGVAMGIIWAYGATDDEGMRHSTRGYGEIVP